MLRQWLVGFIGLLAFGLVTNSTVAAPNVQTVSIPSPALGRDVAAQVYLPPGYQRGEHYRLVVLLHGFNDDFLLFVRLDAYAHADDLLAKGEIVPLVMVAPSTDNSFGVNSDYSLHIAAQGGDGYDDYPKGRYEDFLTTDLLDFMQKTYGAGEAAADRVYAGVSMGGFAALRLGLVHPDLARRIAGHSPAIIGRGFRWLYPDEQAWQNRSLPLLAGKYAGSDQLFYIDCGDQDDLGFHPLASDLAAILMKNNTQVEWHDAQGGHNLDYWREHIEDYLRFYGAK